MKLVLNRGKNGIGIPQLCPYAAYVGSIALTISESKKRFCPSLQLDSFKSIPCLIAYVRALDQLSSIILPVNDLLNHVKCMKSFVDKLQPERILVQPLSKVQHKLREIYMNFLLDVYTSKLPRPKFIHNCGHNPKFGYGVNDIVKLLDQQCNGSNHFFLSYDNSVSLFTPFDNKSFNYLVARRAGLYQVSESLIFCPLCARLGIKKVLTDNHHESCKGCHGRRNELHNALQTTFIEFFDMAGFIQPKLCSSFNTNSPSSNKFLSESKLMVNFIPEKFFNLESSPLTAIKSKYCDTVICIPDYVTNNSSLKKLAFIDYTVSSPSAYGSDKAIFKYHYPGYRAYEREVQKIKMYKKLFKFDADATDPFISTHSLIILSFETNGLYSHSTKRFIDFLAGCIAKKDAMRRSAAIWIGVIQKTIQQKISLYMAQSYIACRGIINSPDFEEGEILSRSGSESESESIALSPVSSIPSANDASNHSLECNDAFHSFAHSITGDRPTASATRQEEESGVTNPWARMSYDFVSTEDQIEISNCLRRRDCLLAYCDGSFTDSSHNSSPDGGVSLSKAGFGTAIYRNSNCDGVVNPSLLISENYGPVSTLFPDISIDIIDNIVAECVGLYALLQLIKMVPDHLSSPILIMYDCQPAIDLVRGYSKSNIVSLNMIVREVSNELDVLNCQRRARVANGFNRISARDLNSIVFKKVRSHQIEQDQDPGNKYVDVLAKRGADGISPTLVYIRSNI